MRRVFLVVLLLALPLFLGGMALAQDGWVQLTLNYPITFTGTDGQESPQFFDSAGILSESTCVRVDVDFQAIPQELMIAIQQGPDRYGANVATLATAPGIYSIQVPLSEFRLIDPTFGNLVEEARFDPALGSDYFILRSWGGGYSTVFGVYLGPNCGAATETLPPAPEVEGIDSFLAFLQLIFTFLD